jgi:hypothetical protein
MPTSTLGALRRIAFIGLSLGPVLLGLGCGQATGDIMGAEGTLPFGGRTIRFQSTYAYFPSDYAVAIVRDTMPQDEACRKLAMYSKTKPPLAGLPVLPHSDEHYALVLSLDSVMMGDDVTLDPTDRGPTVDMRYGVLARYPVGKNQNPTETWPAAGVLRIAELQQYKRVTGEFKLTFPGGENIEESFAIDACP